MYASLKPWINVPYTIRPFIKYNGAGTKQYGDSISSLCYPVGDVKRVVDASGAEVTSTTQLYVPGTEVIKVTDSVIFSDEERPILRITDYYRNGVVDVRVVYL